MTLIVVEFDIDAKPGYDLKTHLEWALNGACSSLEADGAQVTYKLVRTVEY